MITSCVQRELLTLHCCRDITMYRAYCEM